MSTEARESIAIAGRDSWSSGLAQTCSWIRLGYRDFKVRPGLSMFYGASFATMIWAIIALLVATDLHWMLLPAISGALLIGPLVAVGLYQISRQQSENGTTPVDVPIAAPGQILLVGGILMILFMVWMRAATIIFALIYGLRPYAGFMETMQNVFVTSEGLTLLVVGSIVGGLFAALTFAIAVFSIPMLVERRIDAFTAMGLSFLVSARAPVRTILWGAMVTLLSLFGFLTGLIGMVIVFPLLGYATWHAYKSVFHDC